jgi:hypothetical protein
MSRVIVTIHGTGRTDQDFGITQMQVLARHLGHLPRHQAVWWGDLIDAGAHVAKIGAWLIARVHSLAECVLGRPSKHVVRVVARLADFLHRLVNGIDGVVAYFIPSRRREAIRERLRRTLDELTRRGDEIILISESLGCLVAFDVLREEAYRYNIAAWITLGCPLRTLVRTGQRDADLGAINPQTVRRWLNLYAPRDLVAAPIAQVFPHYPIRDECIAGTRSRLQAHRYWSNPRVSALVARVIRE